MQKLIPLFCLFWLLGIQAATFGQQEYQNKLPFTLHQQLQSAQSAGTEIPVLIKGDAAAITQYLLGRNAFIKFSTGNIVSAELDAKTITALQQLSSVEVMDCPKAKLTPLNDVMVLRNNVDSAYMGMWPLDQSYDGTGVVIGIIDAPFDYNHPDFTDAFGNTRIKYLWDQTLTDETLAPDIYSYGVECDSASIAENTCPHVDYNTWYSHGSGVAGVAASSGNAAGNYRGVAPNADLILVTLDFNNDFLTRTVDAVAYVYQKAAELGKPCVINTSFGSYDGAHDGKDLTTQAINNLITEAPGRALVAAGGNAGNQQLHLGYTVSEIPQFTWFKKLTYANAVYFQVFADTADFNNVFFSVGADSPTGWIHKGNTPDYNVLIDYTLTEGGIDSTSYDLYSGLTYVGNVKTYVQLMEGTYMIEVLVTPAVSTDYWRFTTYGAGKFDVWSNQTYTGFSNYVTTGLPTAETVPEIVNYRLPDYTQNIVGYWQCSDKVIT
ncbi:MAG: S8 family serine peptidase, partial [Chitinophagales bacterium]